MRTNAAIPALRVSAVSDVPVRPGRHVLYWMIAARRTRWSFGLQHALSRAHALGLPLIVLEALRVGYRWASPRLHRFVIDGMADSATRFLASPVAYHPYIEPAAGHGSGLLEALAAEAALVVCDEYPCFFLPRMVAAAGARLRDLGVRLEAVDGNGILPLRAATTTFTAAVHFRRFLQRELPRHLGAFPEPDPLALAGTLPRAHVPRAIAARWPAASAEVLADPRALLASLPLDAEVTPVADRGGEARAARVLERFVGERLARYGQARNEPEEDVASGLSPYLHFGQVSAHEVVARVLERDAWTTERLARKPTGSREGWWGLTPEAEGFLDQLVTWRELGFNFCFLRDDYDRWESLPEWARTTLDAHAADPRPWVYARERLEAGETHDALWNAAQQQLRREGRIHNYLRMLWGKKVLEWSATPQEALATLIELNNRWSVDGRDPNSYSGISWTLGRFDRPWGPERPIFGVVRYMSSDNTARKMRVRDYVRRYTGA